MTSLLFILQSNKCTKCLANLDFLWQLPVLGHQGLVYFLTLITMSSLRFALSLKKDALPKFGVK